MEILNKTTMPNFVHFHKRCHYYFSKSGISRLLHINLNEQKSDHLINVWIKSIPKFMALRHLLLSQAQPVFLPKSYKFEFAIIKKLDMDPSEA